jgi:Flp pilus assembly protein TadG
MPLSHLSKALHDTSGSTAIEFAIIAPLFLSIVFSTFESGWIVTKTTMLDRALDTTVREMRVGAASAPTTQAQIKTAICAKTVIIADCEASITVEVTDVTKGTFPASAAQCQDKGSSIQPVVQFSPGERGAIMLIRACVTTDPLTPLLGLALHMPKDSKGGYFIHSSSAFVNEPGA